MSFVITAATGQLGTLVVQNLLKRGVKADDIVATGRSLDRLEALRAQGVRTAVLDYNNPADDVISEGDTVLLISGTDVGQRIAQHGNVVAAAKAGGAARIVYTSVVGADTTSLLVAPEHAATEDAIKESGLTYTIGDSTNHRSCRFDTTRDQPRKGSERAESTPRWSHRTCGTATRRRTGSLPEPLIAWWGKFSPTTPGARGLATPWFMRAEASGSTHHSVKA